VQDDNAVLRRYPEERPLGADEGLWWVVRTRTNCEKIIATYLRNRGISYYIPLYRKKERVGCFGRIRVTDVPLLRGYVCMALERRRHHLLYDSKKWIRVIEVPDQRQFVQELEYIEQALVKDVDAIVSPGLVSGKKVIVRSGPLQGVQGVYLKRRRGAQIGLRATLFNQSVNVWLDPYTRLEPID
jgi:transcription antitermination factor NusG